VRPRPVIYWRGGATPTLYLTTDPNDFLVHFATHGPLAATRPLESAVVLSQEPGGDTYKLYDARDIGHPDLRSELVTNFGLLRVGPNALFGCKDWWGSPGPSCGRVGTTSLAHCGSGRWPHVRLLN